MYTRTCPLACAHCITFSSPKVKERMSFEHAVGYIEAIPNFSTQLGFTGGEPFLYYRDIVRLIRIGKSLGLAISLVTGAGWVRTERQVRSRLETVAEAGLRTLCISWDQYHETYCSVDRPVLLARLAIQMGLNVIVRSVRPANASTEDYHNQFAGLPVKHEHQKIVRLGRAESLPQSHFEMTDDLPGGACSIVYSPVVEPDGNVYACCGPSHFATETSPLLLGNAKTEPLADILERGLKDPILEIINNIGPIGLYQLLKDHPAGRKHFKPRSAYSHACELCLDITNNPKLISAIRERLNDRDAQRLVAISRLWRRNSVAADRHASG
jgi:organic radical activating enzyme